MSHDPYKPANVTCRRCSECMDNLHHFMENMDFGVDDDDPDYLENDFRSTTGNSFMCKHCDAVGDECETCGGDAGEENSDGNFIPCLACGGEGILIAEPKRFKDLDL